MREVKLLEYNIPDASGRLWNRNTVRTMRMDREVPVVAACADGQFAMSIRQIGRANIDLRDDGVYAKIEITSSEKGDWLKEKVAYLHGAIHEDKKFSITAVVMSDFCAGQAARLQ